MSKDKREDDVKKIVKEETEPIGRIDTPWQNRRGRRRREDSGTCSRICGVTSRTPRIQKRGEYGEVESRIVPLCNPLAVQSGSRSLVVLACGCLVL